MSFTIVPRVWVKRYFFLQGLNHNIFQENLKNFSQFFQYGLFKPLVLQKVKSEFKFRHIIPSIFVLYVLLLPLWYNSLLLSSMLFVYFYWLLYLQKAHI